MGTISVLPHVGHVFWGEMAPCEHIVQIYGDDSVFMDGLEGFVGSALRNGESAIVIATANHLHSLESRMRQHGIDVELARGEQRYLPRLAEETLAEFMVEGWPDQVLFAKTVSSLLSVARGKSDRKVRAFGEMVAVLWARGDHAATIELEKLWTAFVQAENFPLYCAYPRDVFPKNAVESMVAICKEHSRLLP